MVGKPLTVRNLTSTPIVLKRVARFSAPEEPKPDISSLSSSFGNLVTNVKSNVTSTPAPIQVLPGDAKPFSHQDVSVQVEPFARNRTDIVAFEKSDKERLRIIIEVDGERHRIQVPVPTSESETMTPLTDHPKRKFTGIFTLNPEPQLTVFSSANLKAWMKELKDYTPLSALSIPGTHNSPTCHLAPPSVRCQAVGPREQLRNGVRFFDIRCKPEFPGDPSKDSLVLVHSSFPISLSGNKYFREMVDEIYGFLENNPSETLIMSIKREGPGNHTDEQLSRVLFDHYAKEGEKRWFTKPKIPTLGEARGKIVLMRRFNLQDRLKKQNDGHGWGIDAGGWADNTPNATCPSGQICIQDFYEVLETENIEKKIGFVSAHLDLSSATAYPTHPPGGPGAQEGPPKKFPFYINFLSASNFWKVGTWPEKIAAKINPATVRYLCTRHGGDKGDWSTGILVTDWVGQNGDWSLARCVVGMNAKLMLKQQQEK